MTGGEKVLPNPMTHIHVFRLTTQIKRIRNAFALCTEVATETARGWRAESSISCESESLDECTSTASATSAMLLPVLCSADVDRALLT